METFFEIVLIIIFLSFLVRKLTPYIIAYFLKRLQKKMRNKFDQNINKDFQTPQKKEKKEKVGEYIDYEEID
ncbi:DUF4834 domain-containing protein [Flavobacteriaceae bacterium]|nr:DUF4834 domain-containing protein [Flavobacteriaceae bacterium]